jgi:membrane protease YdiL (CAAX protease family)
MKKLYKTYLLFQYMYKISILDLEKKSVFFINSFLIILMTIFFLFEIKTVYFFYFNILLTFILSYIFFKKSKKLAKYLIITNMFIFFYFLYPLIASFLYEILGEQSYIYILLYNILLAYIFLVFSGHHKDFLKNINKSNIKIFSLVGLISIGYGLFFYLVKEPVPINLIFDTSTSMYLIKVFAFTFILALSEQIIFAGFLYNIYKQLTHKKEAIFQVATIFVLFHLLRFENLVRNYFINFNSNFLFLLTLYYVFLFLFMITALYFYDFKSKKYSGNFLYPLTLHFITDTTLFVLIIIIGSY